MNQWLNQAKVADEKEERAANKVQEQKGQKENLIS